MPKMELTAEEAKLITERRKKEEEERAAAFQPRSLSSYTVEEKVMAFDQFYQSALDTWNYVKTERCMPKDDVHYAWERTMRLLAQPGHLDAFWAAFNKLCP